MATFPTISELEETIGVDDDDDGTCISAWNDFTANVGDVVVDDGVAATTGDDAADINVVVCACVGVRGCVVCCCNCICFSMVVAADTVNAEGVPAVCIWTICCCCCCCCCTKPATIHHVSMRAAV